jgi:L-ascorbate metabolism protein UlaG (beta-lactamase superfamily)
MASPPTKQKLKRGVQLSTVGLVLLTTGLLADGCTAFGHRASGARLARMEASPNWRDGHFVNPQPLHNDAWVTVKGMFAVSPDVSPKVAVPVQVIDPKRLQTPPESGLRITWLGHSTSLVELDGARILTDPVWSHRASPYTWVGPRRWFDPLIALGELGRIDAVVISHDHYDHLDMGTVQSMKNWTTRFIVPLGVGAHLEAWGISPERITELDWWETTKVGEVEVVCLPARHASGRQVLDKDATLWAGYGIIGAKHRAYYSGDTGLFPAMRQIGEKYGPFDVTMIESGQYHAGWPDWHIGPEQAVRAHQLVRGKLMVPVHWGLFTLAYHAWTEPPERVWHEAQRLEANLSIPEPGQALDPAAPPPVTRWWPVLPYQTAEEAPIVSTQMR